MGEAPKGSSPLRAVGYCRTSGEGQRDNTSIPRQKEAIEHFCKLNSWAFVRHYVDECRSGSRITGRDEFQLMLRHAGDGAFDIFVPFDSSRAGRNAVDILTTAETLKSVYGIHTVDAKSQFDNRSHRNVLTNTIHAGVSQAERLTIMERMIPGKIKRAQNNNVPTSGRLPFGRTFDRTTNEWGIDESQKTMIEEIAKRYLGGQSLSDLAKEFNIKYDRLWRTLRYSCGDRWSLTYRVPDLGIEETVEHRVPSLLSTATIRAVHKRMEANRTFEHGKSKHEYLLQGRIFCAGCGRLMTGAVRPSGVRLYRHNPRSKDCPYNPRPSVRAEDIEAAVINRLYQKLRSPDQIERAIRAAIPKRDDVTKQRSRLRKRMEQILQNIDRAEDGFIAGVLKGERAQQKLNTLRAEQDDLRGQLDELDGQLTDVPTESEIQSAIRDIESFVGKMETLLMDEDLTPEQRMSSLLYGVARASGKSDVEADDESGNHLREVVRWAFSTPLNAAKPSGIYIVPDGGARHSRKQFKYEVLGCVAGDTKSATLFGSSDQSRSAPP